MTDRERFEAKAIENGATIICANVTTLTIKSVDGSVLTTYIFDVNGKFKDYDTKVLTKN